MAAIDRLVPVVKVDPALLHLSVPPRCGCCGLEKKREIQIPAWMFQLSDDDDDKPSAAEKEYEVDQEPQQGQKQLFARYLIGSAPLTKEEAARHLDGLRVADKLNEELPPGQQRYYPVCIMPRSSHKDGFYGLDWHAAYRMHEMLPTYLGCSRFTEQSQLQYKATSMLQIRSVKFVDHLQHGRLQVLVYGFIAARDDLEALPNFLFNRTREEAQEVRLYHPILDLLSPLRGISAFEHVLVEFDLKLKTGTCSADDEVLVDGCIEFTQRTVSRSGDKILRSCIQGSVCSVDMEYMFIRHSVEATVEIYLSELCMKRYFPKITSYIVREGDTHGVCIHEIGRFELMRMQKLSIRSDQSIKSLEHSKYTSPSVHLVTFVLAVPLNAELEVRCSLMEVEHVGNLELPYHFQVQKYGSCVQPSGEHAELMPSGVKVAWSTMGFRQLSARDFLK
uniref:DUF6598 domain-containing protein n=1 Tax=Oryza punctata TaxID=4537 RepID=A0A0E0L406_ORYPU